MVDQIILPLALVNKHVRIWGPVLIFVNHAGIALALGIFFSSMPILGPSIFLPWSRIFPGRVDATPLPKRTTSQRWRIVAASSVAAFLVLVPGLTHKVYHPFADNFIFGWVYSPPEKYSPVAAIGYRDVDGQLKPLPRGYGGFMESRHATTLHFLASQSIDGVTPTLETLYCAARPRDSNRFLLGLLAMPEHRWSAFAAFEPRAPRELLLLEGKGNSDDVNDRFAKVRVEWKVLRSIGQVACP